LSHGSGDAVDSGRGWKGAGLDDPREELGEHVEAGFMAADGEAQRMATETGGAWWRIHGGWRTKRACG